MRKHGMFWKSEHTKKEKKEIINENIFLYVLEIRTYQKRKERDY